MIFLHSSIFLLCWNIFRVEGQMFGNNLNLGQDAFQQTGQGTGNGAAVGDAKAGGQGSATSINQVNQETWATGTKTSSLSANSATGNGASVNGAAQATGNFQGNAQRQSANLNQRQRTEIQPSVNGGVNNGDVGGVVPVPVQTIDNGNARGGGGGFVNGGEPRRQAWDHRHRQRDHDFDDYDEGPRHGDRWQHNNDDDFGGSDERSQRRNLNIRRGGGFGGGGGGGFGGNSGGGGGSLNTRSEQTNSNRQSQQQRQNGGTAAATGNAGTKGAGQATSINQANQSADQNGSQASGLSANTANGVDPSASGASQAGGQSNQARQAQRNFGRNRFDSRDDGGW